MSCATFAPCSSPTAFRSWKDNPVLGVGPGHYGGAAASVFGSPIHDRYQTDRLLTNQETVDNFWLHLGVEGGVAGIAAFLAMIGVALWAPIRAFRRAAGQPIQRARRDRVGPLSPSWSPSSPRCCWKETPRRSCSGSCSASAR